MGDATRPVWIDCETPAGLSLHHIREARDCYLAAGVPVAGVYTYPRYWQWRMLIADTSEFGDLWLAAYGPDPHGLPADIFPGMHAWPNPAGMPKPAMWQFGSNASVAGFRVDINARIEPLAG